MIRANIGHWIYVKKKEFLLQILSGVVYMNRSTIEVGVRTDFGK